MKPIVLLAFATAAVAATASAQSPLGGHPVSDAAKIADALRAGPAFVTRDATILDSPSAPGGEYRVLRRGTSEWTCLPGIPDLPYDEPACFDRVFMQWLRDALAGRPIQIDRVGISYMYAGAWVPHQTAPDETPDKYYHVGPHIMIVSPHHDELQPFTRDAASGMPYINHLRDHPAVFLVIPIRHWDDEPH
jgi:hypothetical protein